MHRKPNAISLFSSSGIGDIALKKIGINVIIANEMLSDRCSLFRRNYPDTFMVEGSITEKKLEIIDRTKSALNNTILDFALVTPPCQGMSKNGRGKLLSEIKAGRRPKVDSRNLLILPALEVLSELQPETIIFENVSEMVNTNIPFQGEILPILDVIRQSLKNYLVEASVLEFADYGIPQRRLRLITIATRHEALIEHHAKHGTLFPKQTHSNKASSGLQNWISVSDTISTLEPLDAKSKTFSLSDPLHKVSALDAKKYWWVSNTIKNDSAFNNQCVVCRFDGNQSHSNKRDSNGVNKSSDSTPIYCQKCKSLLPRPTVERDGKLRLMSGFTSAYKRMDWNLPASAITRNFPYACSDNKIHPIQNRTLSIREACLLHSVQDNDFKFEDETGKVAKLKTIRDTLGESIPPMILEIILRNLLKISKGDYEINEGE
jgi:DNA (cytosine-5)-methyltransferase 1